MKINRNGALASVSAIAALTLVTACGGGGSEQTVSGEGSTAQQKAMEHFSQVLTDNSDIVLDYTGSGSGDGIKKFIAGDVDFAGSDSALKDDEVTDATARCNGNAPWHLPLVVGPVAVAYNLDGVEDLKLNPSVIAQIFNGKITTWNDPKIAALNPGVTLPTTDIVPVYRSDSSGTTDNFQRFLENSAPADWPYEHSKEFAPKGVGSGASKSTGVGDTVKKTPGSITYVEWGFATENDLGVAQIDFGAGPVTLNAESAGNALESLAFADPASKDLVVDTDALFASKAPGAYPLLLTPYSIVCSAGYEDEATSQTLKDAFTAVLNDGQAGLEEIGYVPVPDAFKTKLQGTIDSLSGGSGNA
ncbi:MULTISPECIES: phosphate ABC transporter substrate-binding protein PstS [Gordonia]|uniref:phosphate ABC transporter substrate-binding protein PstS n=1 Tax=Gordonia TaxID=2053 RepID=UPI0010F95757|nr:MULTISPECIES: phosphate ABC transporter substrate-binding protein PstS [Gordonia]MBN0974923.1 phosphate ABC transporter substrate-binding protein PstS [Gordonia sp. BP-119]MBN0984920.1 phosphate ABC transporter substrate-binding protein PstS [Gordonia sp. BP-94]UPG67520.1 phosphate ABC transporter substrate-binding protein PstS [Gordonia hongkongensis]WGJ84833.1 phosphate ABC transporter substrate-binding protein PstS [Gordonia sp. SMJS1]